jgi:excisionase family DNA binding protein
VTDPRDLLGPVLAAAVEALAAERVTEALAALDLGGERWPAYLTVPEAAAYLGVTVERVRKLIARRAMPVVQEAPGHRVTLARSDLDALMLEWRQEARA